MYHPTTRLLTILELLQSRTQLSGKELAARLEVHPRSVRRYIMMLQDLGIPVEGERGRGGSYRLRPGFKLPPLMFNEDEALAIMLGLKGAQQLGLAGAAPAVEGALAKVERVLPGAVRQRLQALQEILTLDISSQTPNRWDSTLLSILSEAAGAAKQVVLTYRSGGRETMRLCDPYGLVFRMGYWYLVGYCHLRHGLRIFRLDRVIKAEAGGGTFERPPGFDSFEYLAHTFGNELGLWRVEVKLDMALEEAERRIPAVYGSLERAGNGVLYRCAIDNLDGLARYLVYLGCDFKICHPPELVEATRQLAAKLTSIADGSES